MSKKGRREEWHKLTTYARIGEYDKKTKKWVYHCEKVVLKVSDPHGPKVSHNVIDLSVSHRCPMIRESSMDFEDRLANMSDEEYERYMRLKKI